MSRMLALLPLLFACGPGVPLPPVPVVQPLAPLGEPFITMYAQAAPGYFRDGCEMGIEIFELGNAKPAGSVKFPVEGGEWGGLPLQEGVEYTLSAEWKDCTTNDTGGSGTFVSTSPFSAAMGVLPVFLYNGLDGKFGVAYQEEHFVGGTAIVTFVPAATSADVNKLSERIGVLAEIVDLEGTTYEITWDSTMSVGEVLSAFADDNIYFDGEPIWNNEPGWYKTGSGG